jgi:hypothetical protein
VSGMSLAAMRELVEAFPIYMRLRQKHPEVPAIKVAYYLMRDVGERFEELVCPGHEWNQSPGEADENFLAGEGCQRIYCLNCGADGDA